MPETLHTHDGPWPADRLHDDDMSLTEWLNHPTEGYDEYIHAVPGEDRHTMHLYRETREVGFDGGWIHTAVDMSVRTGPRDTEPADRWYLTGGQAHTLLTWLRCLARDQQHVRAARWTWYDDNGQELTKGTRVTEEGIWLRYDTSSGRTQRAVINSVRTDGVEVHRMGKYD